MATTYEDILVFRTLDYNEPDHILGKAKVEVISETKTIITIEAGKDFTDFLRLGDLRALNLGGFVANVNHEEATAYWKRLQ